MSDKPKITVKTSRKKDIGIARKSMRLFPKNATNSANHVNY